MLGFCGAGDSNSFKAALQGNYQQSYRSSPSLNLPKITYEGVFSEHYYNYGQSENDILSLKAFQAYSENILTQDQQLWAACLFDSNKDGLQRDQPIDISLVLDISGSMASPISYTDRSIQKIDLAKKAIIDLVNECLQQSDSFGLATFNTEGQVIQPITPVNSMNLKEISNKVQSQIKVCGGTTVYAGLKTGINMFYDYNAKNQEKNRQKRILFLTDMLDMNGTQLEELIQEAAKQQIYVSVIGIGVDFNNNITDLISKHVGCNYFSITKNQEMRETIVDQFSFNFFPLAYNVDLKMQTEDFEIIEVYGSPFGTAQNENLEDNLKQFRAVTEINTYFPCPIDAQKGKLGGLILIKLQAKNFEKPLHEIQGDIIFNVNYTLGVEEDAQVYQKEIPLKINLQQQSHAVYQQNYKKLIYENETILKGILLQKYTETCKQFSQENELKEFQLQDLQYKFDIYKQDYINIVKDKFDQNNNPELYETYDNFEKFLQIILKFKQDKQEQEQEQAKSQQ